ncbi:alpha/beta fold hydrolase [Ornithinimicrobium sufpigmenti]|uniref:alpha/beta fold hydrolase n=1 Tax=Ornithinimicrobium sufpigmenti TaxID=2508882 RepID=UPI0010367710|nr:MULTISPECIES: alpha/beta hydrolase [unclassified Ornithinimicrobium]
MTMQKQQAGPFEVRVWQQGEGPGLLYLHGVERHAGDAPFLTRLAQKRDVRAPEFPGYGESTGFEAIHDLQDVTLALRAMVEDWGWGSVDIIGHSFGGMLAAELAVVAPHLVRNLVLVDSYGLWSDEEPVADVFALMPPELDEAKWHDTTNKGSETNVAASGLEAAIERTTNFGSSTKFLWPIPDRGLSRRLPYLQARTLIVHGASDGIVPVSYAHAFADAIDGAQVHVVEQAGHLPMFEREDEFLTVVTEFLDQEA